MINASVFRLTTKLMGGISMHHNRKNVEMAAAETSTASSQTQSEAEDSGLEDKDKQRRYQCGDFCSFNIFKIPGLLLRNVIFPRDQWDEYPDGFDRIADRFVFQPQSCRDHVPTPEYFGIDCFFEEVSILTKDKVKLHAYLVKDLLEYDNNDMSNNNNSSNIGRTYEPLGSVVLDQNENLQQQQHTSSSTWSPTVGTAPTIIYFHGNAGNVGYCLDVVKRYKSHSQLKACNFLLVDYRGYGKSEGEQSEKGVYSDAKAAFKYVEGRSDLNSKRIVLMGQSLGGAVCIHLASRRRYRKKIAALILENTFTSIPNLAKTLLGMVVVNYLPKCCYSCKFESINKIAKVKCPTLFLSATEDEIVPHDMMNLLYEKCGADVKIIEKFDDVGHNNTYTAYDYLPKVADFMRKIFNFPRAPNQENSTANAVCKNIFISLAPPSGPPSS